MDNQDFQKYIEGLPPELKQAIYSIDYPKQLQEITAKHKMMIDQAGKFEVETTLVMAGVEPLNQYINNLVKHVGLSESEAIAVAKDTDELIFKNIRESLRKINDQIAEEEKIAEENQKEESEYQEKIPEKDELLSDIENPENIKGDSVSISSLKSNSDNPENIETIEKGIEVRLNNLPKITSDAILPTRSSITEKQIEPFHQNISPVANIVDEKLNKPVVTQKQTLTVEEKTKLPEKPIQKSDPYREPIN